MNIKQFLKPDWRKIVVFVVLIILFFLTEELVMDSVYYYLINKCMGGPCGENGGCYYNVCTFGKIKIYYFYNDFDIRLLPLVIFFDPLQLFNLSLDYLIYPFTIFYLYLFSCFIIWIYDKFRKK